MSEASERIVGGHEVNFEDVQSTVALIDKVIFEATGDYFYSQYCGGTLWHERWVVTAAHCLSHPQTNQPVSESELYILAGSSDLLAPVHQHLEVEKIFIHPDYEIDSNGALLNDIALVKLAVNAPTTPVEIEQGSFGLESQAYITGWGTTKEGGEFPHMLLGANVNLYSATDCLMRTNYQEDLFAFNVCAGVLEGGIDSCQGDSGGPLYKVNAGDSSLTLLGITSSGTGCARPGYPGIYTLVSPYISWLRLKTGEPLSGPTTNPDDLNPDDLNNGDSGDDDLLIGLAAIGATTAAASSDWLMVSIFAMLVLLRRCAVPLTRKESKSSLF